MAEKHKHAKHPASDHLRKAADALDELHQQMAGKQSQAMLNQQQASQGQTAGPMPGVSPLGGVAR